MFNRVRDKIRYLIIGIGSTILVVAFILVYFVLRTNIENTTKDSLSKAIEIIVKDQKEEKYKETEVMIFRIENNMIIHYNDNYKKYNSEVLFDLYQNCKDLKNNPTTVGLYYFYYSVISLDGEYVYFVYDASLAMNNLNLLLVTLATFFIILICLITLVAIYVSNKIIDPLEVTYIKQKEFMENASHELKTPLTIINANVDSLGDINENNQKWINNIKSQTERMNKLVVEILELFRIESQSKDNDINIDLSNYLNKAILSFEVLTYEKNINLIKNIEDNIIVKSKESNIDKMVNILLDNALKYVSENGYINIELRKEKKKILLIVENSGGSLDKEDLDKIFERFYKKNEEDNKSFGLGLAILKAIVSNLDGEILVECEKEKYTRFIIRL